MLDCRHLLKHSAYIGFNLPGLPNVGFVRNGFSPKARRFPEGPGGLGNINAASEGYGSTSV